MKIYISSNQTQRFQDSSKKKYLMSLLAQLETQKGAFKDKAIITIKKIAQPEAVI